MSLSIGEVENIVGKACDLVVEDDDLKSKLRDVNFVERWGILEDYMFGKLDELGLKEAQYQLFGIREWILYTIQERTGIDLHFCEYFRPDYRGKVNSFLTHKFSLGKGHRCACDGEGDTTCSGTQNQFCKIYDSQKRDDMIKDYSSMNLEMLRRLGYLF